MKKNIETKEEHPIRLRYYLLGAVALWSILIGLSLAWNLRIQDSETLEAARIEARTAFEKDVLYRRWNAALGGVYAPVTGETPPNPYLDTPERDITTLLGKKLTKINPAYMTRQVHELARKTLGVRGHITSLNPIRPANAPDPWETRSLKSFQMGLKEVSSVEGIEGNEYMRLMRPLLTENNCLKCHAAQGYKLGDIRGGISVSVPMAPLMDVAQSHVLALCVGHGLLWLIGLVGIGFAFRRLNHQIHKRMGVEEALRESEGRYRLLADNITDNIWVLDLETLSFSYVSPSVEGITGYSAEEATGLQLQDVLTPASMKLSTEILSEELVRESQHPDPSRSRILELEQYRKDGTTVWTEVSMQFIHDIEGRPSSILGVTRDVAERKLAEEAMRESELQFKSTFELAAVGICHADPSGTFLKTNQRFSEILGYSGNELNELTWQSITHPDDLNADLEKAQQVLENRLKTYTIEKRFFKKDGVIIWVNLTVSLVRKLDGTPHYFIGVIEDLSERKNMESQLQRAQKMEAMGLMAGGIAHDLNNILSGIVSYPELLLMDLPEDSPLRKPIKTIQESGMRAADVVEDLLTIARGVASGKEVLNLNTVIEAYLDSAEHQKLEKIHPLTVFKTDLDSELLNITGSASHVNKVLTNLAVNASEAIEGKGTVTISTTNRYLDEPLRGYEDVRTGEYVMLTVSDDGSGISPQDLDRIFEPFYTKKVMGRSGTGLGLAVVWNSMQDHDGYINIKTSERGTVFELYFPVTREETATEKEEVPLGDYLGHGEKILVVDDEERQREIASGILTKLGYNAETVSSGEAAIRYVKENAVDLIVLDMVMPKGINGLETYEEIIKIHPGQKAIIASGYAKTKEVNMAQELGAGKYIKKPYALEKVGLAVKVALEK